MLTTLRRTALAALALSLFGCDDGANHSASTETGVAALKAALPKAEAMSIRLPTSTALVPAQATFYGFTRETTLGVNGFVRDITNLIEDVVEQTPTETDGETYAVWGPYTDPLSPATWRVRATRVDGGIDYVVEGWPKGENESAARSVLAGNHRDGEPATGNWTYSLSVAKELDPTAHKATGQVAVIYSAAAARELEVMLTDVQGPSDPLPITALYRYTEAADRAGTFDFVINGDIHEGDPARDRRELVQVRSRWLPTGPGRADVRATHGDLPAGETAVVAECWDAAFQRTFVSFAYGDEHVDDGDLASCAYTEAEAPDFEAFDPNAFADADLVEALPEPGEFEAVPVPVVAPVAEPALYYRVAHEVLSGLSAHIGGVLDWIQAISRHPPTSCNDEGCIWGPWTDAEQNLSFELVIQRAGEGHFTYVLNVKRPADELWQAMVTGAYTHSGVEGEGQGALTFDLNVLADIDASAQSRGVFSAEYLRQADHTQIAARFEDLAEAPDGEAKDFEYFFDATVEGGLLDLWFPTDVNEESPVPTAEEDVAVRIRWQPNGAGVANALVTQGDMGETGEAVFVECWDATAARSHIDYVVRLAGAETPTATIADACVFDDFVLPVRR